MALQSHCRGHALMSWPLQAGWRGPHQGGRTVTWATPCQHTGGQGGPQWTGRVSHQRQGLFPHGQNTGSVWNFVPLQCLAALVLGPQRLPCRPLFLMLLNGQAAAALGARLGGVWGAVKAAAHSWPFPTRGQRPLRGDRYPAACFGPPSPSVSPPETTRSASGSGWAW